MHYRLYNLICFLVLTLAAPLFILYSFVTQRHYSTIKPRMGFFSGPEFKRNSQPRLWFHAASVGEVKVAKALINKIDKHLHQAEFIVTTVTEQGYRVATRQFGSRVFCTYAPIDIPWVVKRFITILQPTVYICLETELWPNMLKIASKENIQLLLLNGRISENSFKNYQKISSFTKEILSCFSTISTIMPHDQDRFIALGAPKHRTTVNGNAKYDICISDITPPFEMESNPEIKRTKEGQAYYKDKLITYYRNRLELKEEQNVLVAGSTHEDEEQQLISIFPKLKQAIPDLVLIIAPRHLQRLPKLITQFEKLGVTYQLYSKLKNVTREQDIVLLDTMGELASIYSIATYVFCGGSLVAKGGHNLMEPIAWGKPPFYGKHMDDFMDAKKMLDSAQAGFAVSDSQKLCEQIIHFHENAEQYYSVVNNAIQIAANQQDTAKRQAKLIIDTVLDM